MNWRRRDFRCFCTTASLFKY